LDKQDIFWFINSELFCSHYQWRQL